ncbi:AMY-1-associating protein expressed in testis 1 [Intoshia linei]|uniref:Cilia- and flagella-associated protein 91 n=1 Tax=Intoshia linei TaxID=1819745 RepID=A0A177B3H0_9BILA|nr:AMY-1-associating protein expressed in testis 1 [Intoshia linei]
MDQIFYKDILIGNHFCETERNVTISLDIINEKNVENMILGSVFFYKNFQQYNHNAFTRFIIWRTDGNVLNIWETAFNRILTDNSLSIEFTNTVNITHVNIFEFKNCVYLVVISTRAVHVFRILFNSKNETVESILIGIDNDIQNNSKLTKTTYYESHDVVFRNDIKSIVSKPSESYESVIVGLVNNFGQILVSKIYHDNIQPFRKIIIQENTQNLWSFFKLFPSCVEPKDDVKIELLNFENNNFIIILIKGSIVVWDLKNNLIAKKVDFYDLIGQSVDTIDSPLKFQLFSSTDSSFKDHFIIYTYNEKLSLIYIVYFEYFQMQGLDYKVDIKLIYENSIPNIASILKCDIDEKFIWVLCTSIELTPNLIYIERNSMTNVWSKICLKNNVHIKSVSDSNDFYQCIFNVFMFNNNSIKKAYLNLDTEELDMNQSTNQIRHCVDESIRKDINRNVESSVYAEYESDISHIDNEMVYYQKMYNDCLRYENRSRTPISFSSFHGINLGVIIRQTTISFLRPNISIIHDFEILNDLNVAKFLNFFFQRIDGIFDAHSILIKLLNGNDSFDDILNDILENSVPAINVTNIVSCFPNVDNYKKVISNVIDSIDVSFLENTLKPSNQIKQAVSKNYPSRIWSNYVCSSIIDIAYDFYKKACSIGCYLAVLVKSSIQVEAELKYEDILEFQKKIVSLIYRYAIIIFLSMENVKTFNKYQVNQHFNCLEPLLKTEKFIKYGRVIPDEKMSMLQMLCFNNIYIFLEKWPTFKDYNRIAIFGMFKFVSFRDTAMTVLYLTLYMLKQTKCIIKLTKILKNFLINLSLPCILFYGLSLMVEGEICEDYLASISKGDLNCSCLNYILKKTTEIDSPVEFNIKLIKVINNYKQYSLQLSITDKTLEHESEFSDDELTFLWKTRFECLIKLYMYDKCLECIESMPSENSKNECLKDIIGHFDSLNKLSMVLMLNLTDEITYKFITILEEILSDLNKLNRGKYVDVLYILLKESSRFTEACQLLYDEYTLFMDCVYSYIHDNYGIVKNANAMVKDIVYGPLIWLSMVLSALIEASDDSIVVFKKRWNKNSKLFAIKLYGYEPLYMNLDDLKYEHSALNAKILLINTYNFKYSDLFGQKGSLQTILNCLCKVNRYDYAFTLYVYNPNLKMDCFFKDYAKSLAVHWNLYDKSTQESNIKLAELNLKKYNKLWTTLETYLDNLRDDIKSYYYEYVAEYCVKYKMEIKKEIWYQLLSLSPERCLIILTSIEKMELALNFGVIIVEFMLKEQLRLEDSFKDFNYLNKLTDYPIKTIKKIVKTFELEYLKKCDRDSVQYTHYERIKYLYSLIPKNIQDSQIETDFARVSFKSQAQGNRIKYVPVLDNLFSDLRNCERFTVQIKENDQLPSCIYRKWKQCSQGKLKMKRHEFVTTNYIYRPLLSYLQRTNIEFWTSNDKENLSLYNFAENIEAKILSKQYGTSNECDKMKNVSIQTMYRESECQTLPFTPAHQLAQDILENNIENYVPEILTLASLSYKNGLPAGLAEVEMIERARIKRAWEKTLPPLSDVENHDKRMRLMEEMERKEWALREAEIDKLQDARIELLKRMLIEREEKTFKLKNECILRIWNKKKDENIKSIKKIRNNHVKDLRKLIKNKNLPHSNSIKRDIIKEYDDPASTVYAPLSRNGVFIDRNSEKYRVKSKYLETYQGICELERWLSNKLIRVDINLKTNNIYTANGFIKRNERIHQEIAEIHKIMKDSRENPNVEAVKASLRFLKKIPKPIARPVTPTIEFPDTVEEDVEVSIINLQRLVRGRAIQNLMHQSKHDRIKLIRELRSTHALQKHDKIVVEQIKKKILTVHSDIENKNDKKRKISNIIGGLESSVLCSSLDFLSKELVRLQEERRIQAFSMLASRQRRMREAEESGRRQIVDINHSSVDTYLQDVIITSMKDFAENVSREQVMEQAKIINDISHEMNKNQSNLNMQEIVAEMVHAFLIPEVYKSHNRDKIKQQQRKYIYAAHKEIYQDEPEKKDKVEDNDENNFTNKNKK